LQSRSRQIRGGIDSGVYGELYVPAFEARDLALVLADRTAQLPPENRDVAEPAIGLLVRMVWLLDSAGDIGNREQIHEAYTAFASAVTSLESAFGTTGRP
jgi:hypothetical protein